MKILHYMDCSTVSWLETWIAHIGELAKLGAEGAVLCRPGGDIADRARRAGLEVYEWQPMIPSLPMLSPGYARIVREARPDAVHTRLSSAAGIAGAWARSTGVPHVSTIDKPAKGKYYRKMDRLIACSRWIKQIMVEREGLPAEMIDVIYNPVDLRRLARVDASRESFRETLGIPRGAIVFAGMGVYVKRKAFDVAIRAFARVVSASPGREMRLALIGAEGEQGQKREYKDIAARLGVADRLIMPEGFVKDVRPWLWASDIFVMPSREEGLGIALLEAMAAGLPAVVSDIGPFKEVTRDGALGIMFPVDDADAMAAAMTRAMTMSADERGRMLSDASKHLEANFAPKVIARATVDLYERLASR